jgi:hypothetical protein
MHRLLALVAILALPLSAATFETRSPHHMLTVERTGVSVYEVRVTDLDSNRVLLTATLDKDRPSASVSGDPSVRVDATETPRVLTVSLRVESGAPPSI